MRITLLSLFSFLLFCYCIYITFQISLASAKCLADQESLLLHLKNNVTFDHEYSTKLILWNKSTACCNWSGVTCDSEGHVIGLDLSAEYIYGGLDNTSSLFGLQHLQKLNLAFNNFNSSIPSAFNKLEKLTYLNLTDARFHGKIPIEISQLIRLVTLDISSPDYFLLQGLTISHHNLQKLFQNLTNLRQLYLDRVSISAKGHEWINALLPLRDLQELSMSYCGLLGPLDSSLTKLENLSVIILDGNYFSSPVPETFANFKNLTTLSLAFCALSGTFPDKIFQIGTLSVIDLFSNENLHGSFPNYSLSESLHRIRVSVTNFSGALPSSIGNLRHLSELDLSVCQFNGTLPNSLSNLQHLSHLDLSSNKFTGPIPFFDIKRLQNLVTINLSNNSINGIIPSFLFRLPLLQELWLSFNQFSILEEFTIISSSLNILDLSSNDLSGPFPISIIQLGSLYSLDLSSNKFNESLQLDKLFELKNLTSLYLSYNNLSINGKGSNVDLSSIPNFEVLRLASCNLQTFPRFLRNQSSLAILDLSDNQIHGIVPNWMWKLPYLQVLNISHNSFIDLEGPMQNLTSIGILDLHNNQLQGSIPVFSKSSDYLDYSTNKFSVIPQDIGNYLSSTKFLSLSNNNLQGNIPHSLCKASNLQVLDISFNNISGTIPPCLMTMTRILEALNLRKNNLTGPIPDMFPPSCTLRTLNFHENLLHGPIPKSLSHCSSLKVLDIGSNQIVGGYPCILKNIPTLSVLVLRNNKLHGSLECSTSLENKPWKMIQIVDIAFNNFNGKLLEKYFKWERFMHDENNVRSDFIHSQDNQESYYQDSVTISNKGQQMELVKILTIFTAIDLSSNHFEGQIPEVMMNFKALHVLNFSSNYLSGEIPSSIGNLKQLESLDLSNNSLVGEIPVQLASLSFLSYLNLSFNHFAGKIPTGTQLQSFDDSSFKGNEGLYGPPLTRKSHDKKKELHSHPTCRSGKLSCLIDWNFLSVELGFIFGLGSVIGPIMFWKQWRVGYWKLMDKIL